MKRLKRNQLGPWCSFCPPRTNKAVFRQDGFRGSFCCEEHVDKLLEVENEERKREGRMTEADYQTWGTL